MKCAAALALLAVLSAGCAQSQGAGGTTYVAPADAGGDAALANDTGAAPSDVAIAVGNLPPGPVLELKANKDYMGGALEVIQTAHVQLDITEFETTAISDYLAILVGALKAAQARGVNVRVLMDDEIANNALVVADLKAAGINAKLDGTKSVRTHVKLIRSEQGFVLGSTNWSQSSMYYNNETNFLVRDAAANTAIAGYFEALWNKPTAMKKVATSADPNVALYSDGGYKGVVQPLLQAAKTRILLCTYAMNVDDSDVKSLLADVAAAVKRGVSVRVVLDQSPGDFGDPTLNIDAGAYLKNLGAVVRNDPDTVITHAKFIVIDDTVVLGSNNWGHGGFVSYHEAGVKTKFAAAVTAVVAYFEKLWLTGTAV